MICNFVNTPRNLITTASIYYKDTYRDRTFICNYFVMYFMALILVSYRLTNI